MPIPGTGGTDGHREAIRSRSAGTTLTAALESQPAAELSPAWPARSASWGTGATAPIYRRERDLDHQTARRAGLTVGRSREDRSTHHGVALIGSISVPRPAKPQTPGVACARPEATASASAA